jgi:membrane-associated HD superfamily phosphohydrolase
MPPKAKKTPAAGASTDYYGEQQLADETVIMEEKLRALKCVYLERMEKLAEKKQLQLELETVVQAREAELQLKKDEKADVLTDYTRVYKVDEQKAVRDVAVLDAALNSLQEVKRKTQNQLEESTADYDSQIKSKKREYELLCERMANMEKEFVSLLSDVAQSAP